MPSPEQTIAARARAALLAAFGPEHADADPVVRLAGRPEFGDYQINAAMALAKTMGRAPRDVAQSIVDHFDASGLAEPPTVAGAGFINVKLLDDFIAGSAQEEVDDARMRVQPAEPARTIVVEYSQPNVAKEMHVGHLRSTIIGDALARVLAFLAHRVIRQNHLGDWGTPYGMIIEEYLDELADGRGHGTDSIEDVTALYRKASERFRHDDVFAERARQRVVMLQGGDAETLALWHELVKLSLAHINEIYQRLGVLLSDADVHGESAYNDDLANVIDELLARGLARIDVDPETGEPGAVVAYAPGMRNREGEPLGTIIRKSDGGYLYATTDLAAIRYRVRVLAVDQAIYVVDNRQADHFRQVFGIAREAGWLPDGTDFEFAGFGTINGPDGAPLKTRTGEVFSLASLLDEAEERALALVREKSPDLDDTEQRALARAVGIGAVKYADLANQRIKNYVFSWDRMLAMDGNTAPYLQYAHARICSIERRADADGVVVAVGAPLVLREPQERALALAALRFGDVVRHVDATLEPHHLCTYLFEFAQTFTAFYECCPVLRADTEALRQSRLRLCRLAARVLSTGLDLLGIESPQRI